MLKFQRKIFQSLVEWYLEAGRPLPWRLTTDAYAIYLSEVVMQQTRVEQGTAYYNRLLERFPTVEALAAADIDSVLKLWEGLGYYSRAHNLHRTAQAVAALHGGRFPDTVQGLQSLPGIGPYTARAVASFAYGVPVAVLDGNVFRVLSRLAADDTPIDLPRARAHFQALADDLLAAGLAAPALATSSVFNSAMMDFGSAVCTPRSPRCGACVVQDYCAAAQAGVQDSLPVKAKRMERPLRRFDALYIWDAASGRFVARQRPASGFWRGLYELPTVEVAEGFAPPPAGWQPLTTLQHAFTHFGLEIRVLQASPEAYDLRDGDRWLSHSDRQALAFPQPFNRFFDWLAGPKSATLF